MRWFRPVSAAGLVLLLAVAARAQDCDDASNMMELDACAGVARDHVAAQMAADVDQIARQLGDDTETIATLRAAQKAWMAYRDAECVFQTFDTRDGSIHSMLQTKCETALMLDRIKQLAVYKDCEEGDMFCPVPAPE